MTSTVTPFRTFANTRYILPVAGFLLSYFLILIITTVLAEQIILDSSTFNNVVLIVLAVVFYLLLGLGLLGVWRYYHKQTEQVAQEGLRKKISITFVLIALLTSVPLGYIAIRVAIISTDIIVQSDLFDAVDKGLEVVYGVYEQKIKNLTDAVRTIRVSSAELLQKDWSELTGRYGELVYLTYIKSETEVLTVGESNFVFSEWPALSEDGQWLPNVRDPGRSEVIWRVDIPEGYFLLVARMPDKVSLARDLLQKNREFLLQVRTYRSTFLFMFFFVFLFLALPLFFLIIITSFVWSNQLTKPLTNLKNALSEVKSGNYHQRLPIESSDEIGQLTKIFNEMVSDLEETKKKILIGEKIETWKDIAQQLAHEIRNPLTPIRLSSERLLRKYREDPARASELVESSMEKVLDQVDRLETLLVEFHEFARSPAPVPQIIDFDAMYREITAELDLRYPGVEWINRFVTVSNLKVDPWQFRKMLTILLSNAVEASSPPIQVHVETAVVEEEKKWFKIVISDRGVGIPEAYRRKIFQPYFTTKPNGTGLGLAYVERVVHEHGGRIWFESEVGSGTSFYLLFPLEA